MQPAGSSGFRGEDALLCVAVLAFTVAHYRLLGLIVNVLPPDPRRQGDSQDTQRRRPWRARRHLADPVEVGILLLTLPVWAILGHLAWAILSLPWEVAGMPARLVRLILLAWAVGIGLFVTSALLGLWKRRQHSAAEATLFLQDTLWRETRGDQRRLQRWARLGAAAKDRRRPLTLPSAKGILSAWIPPQIGRPGLFPSPPCRLSARLQVTLLRRTGSTPDGPFRLWMPFPFAFFC